MGGGSWREPRGCGEGQPEASQLTGLRGPSALSEWEQTGSSSPAISPKYLLKLGESDLVVQSLCRVCAARLH